MTATAKGADITVSPELHAGLRQRKPVDNQSDNVTTDLKTVKDDNAKEKEEINWGKTASGEVFKVPATHSFVHTILTTIHRSSLTRLTTASLIAQPILFYLLWNHPTTRSVFFLLYFAFWRGCYDWGFAWVLRQQSERKWVVKSLKKRGWLDTESTVAGGEEGQQWAKWWKRELEMKMGEGYKWEDVPPEFNAWLMFRQLVDVVLLNDFISYSLFAWSNLHFPPNHSVLMHIFRWAFGWSLIFFNLWVKIDAHRVVKDYAWYWGDAFWMMVMQHDLVFDGVYEIAPHPMYSVGYAGYYGLSIVVGSYSVLFVSLAAHAAQFAFLLWFENPHIERTYGGGKKPLASRVPLTWGSESTSIGSLNEETKQAHITTQGATNPIELPTPAATEGETGSEPELSELTSGNEDIPVAVRKPRADSNFSIISQESHTPRENVTLPATRKRSKTISMHDLTHRFFRKPVIVLSKIDVFRATDFSLIILLLYSLSTLVPPLPHRLGLTMHFLHALSWRLFHSFGLGLLLRAQSKSKWYVRHYLKHYHYPSDEVETRQKEGVVKRATEEAFGNWQVGYNISLVMTYVSFAGLAWKTYHLPMDWTVSGTMLRHVLGLALIGLHVWAAVSSYEVLGDFGWLYSDFFLIEQIPSQLAYTGIYRFLNNPERSMGGAAFFGMWLISNSKLVLALAVVSHLSHWWFLSSVEKPHMKRLYGDRLRKDGGLTKTLKSVAGRTLPRAGKHGPEIQRVVQGVSGSLEKVEERMTEAVEGFLDHARPRFEEMVNDTKTLLQQSRERMIFTRTSSDISAFNPSEYDIKIPTSSRKPVPRFHVGQPIKVFWTAPSHHSRKDWIGIYRLGSCRSKLVTRISSMGKWVPIHSDEYDGEFPIETGRENQVKNGDTGAVVFAGDSLPWAAGEYELRYHHDGKHNVMSTVGQVEIFVNRPVDGSFATTRTTLLNIVCLSLDQDPALQPRSAKTLPPSASVEEIDDGEDGDGDENSSESLTPTFKPDKSRMSASPIDGEGDEAGPAAGNDGNDVDDPEVDEDDDDFIIMSEKQAKRVVSLTKASFDVELSMDVVIAEPNVGALARRVLGAKSLSAKSGG